MIGICNSLTKTINCWGQWLMAIIIATQEAEAV
jgi:hypothetical protein